MGRSTAAAIRNLTEIVSETPDFAPAHRSLAGIYALASFHDLQKERGERSQSLALCPGAVLARRPVGLPSMSSLMNQAEEALVTNDDQHHAEELAIQAVREDEWRLQRIRPFDWYSVDFKRRN